MTSPANSVDSKGAVPRISARDVTMKFGGITALDSVSVDVPAGAVVGLIGPNGAGKSTLFSVLSGLRKPTSGQVFMQGSDVTVTSPQQRAHHGLARTFQHPELFSGLTVREHVVLGHRMRHSRTRLWRDLIDLGGLRRSPAAETERVDDLIEALGLTEIADHPAAGMPLGVSRRVEVARALAQSPSVLLLDEPTSGLDGRETEELEAVLRAVVDKRGVSLLFVEHDVELVLRLCSYLYVLDFGKCIAAGTPVEIRANRDVQAAYLGEEVNA
jgi:ABC-type branched-subunit amino acid transport system ATPase component